MSKMWRYSNGNAVETGDALDAVANLYYGGHLRGEFIDCLKDRFGSAVELWDYLDGDKWSDDVVGCLKADLLCEMAENLDEHEDVYVTYDGTVVERAREEEEVAE